MKRLSSTAFGLLFLVLLAGCRTEKSYRSAEGTVYGTFYHISYASGVDLHAGIREEMERVNRSLSMFNPQSLLSRINRNETDSTDVLFRRMYGVAREVYRQTDGGYDITVAPLVNAWGFGTEGRVFPDSARIDSLLAVVGMDRIRLENGRLVKQAAGTTMDVSSIAKGLGVDLVAEYLDARGITDYMVEIGGEVRVKGISSRGRSWRIGIDRPQDDPEVKDRTLQSVLALDSGALATSGNYRNFFIHGGKKYAHTINPKTGYPVQTEVLAASVYAPTCMEADAYATGFMVVGLKRTREILEGRKGLEAFLIYTGKEGPEVWCTDGFHRLVCDE